MRSISWPLTLVIVILACPGLAPAQTRPTKAAPKRTAKAPQRAAKAPKRAAKAPKRTKRVKDAIRFIDQSLIHLRLGFWGARMVQNGRKYAIGLTSFGSMGELFFEDRLATKHFNAYKAFYATGFSFTMLGLAALLVDMVLLIASPLTINSPTGLPLTLGLLIGGAVFGLTGPILIGVAHNRLMQAVETYNQGVFSRARKGKWSVTMGLRHVTVCF